MRGEFGVEETRQITYMSEVCIGCSLLSHWARFQLPGHLVYPGAGGGGIICNPSALATPPPRLLFHWMAVSSAHPLLLYPVSPPPSAHRLGC